MRDETVDTTFASLEQITGVKHDDNKPRWDLLPPDALGEVAQVLTFGAKKYAPRNWELGMDWGRLVAAQMRHLAAFQKGEDIDPESGLHHLAHASCCALMLHALYLRGDGKDDRPKIAMRETAQVDCEPDGIVIFKQPHKYTREEFEAMGFNVLEASTYGRTARENLYAAFDWGKSPQGWTYWFDISLVQPKAIDALNDLLGQYGELQHEQ